MKFPSWFIKFYESTKNIIHWFPVIWNDRDFDFGYLYDILYFKLKNMKNYFSNAEFIVQEEYDKYVKDLTECIDMLESIKDEKILMNAHTVFCEKNIEYTNNEFEERSDGELYHRSMDENTSKSWNEIMSVAYKNKEKERMNFFKKLGERIEYWWD